MPKTAEPAFPGARRARLFRNGRNQALRIPRDFELPGTEAIVTKEDDRLLIEPVRGKPRLLDVLAGLKPLAEDFPDIDEGLPPADEVNL